ncbi:MAG: cysteine hydrolase, partial [Chloroflexi bacterium]|nr:cysteine hydrolase [Chloroflexota bacterium]
MDWDPLDLYLEAFGLTEADLQSGEREKVLAQEQLFTRDWRGFELLPAETALIVVDAQNHFVHPDSEWRCYEATRQIPRIVELVGACRELGVPVIFTATVFADDVIGPFRARFAYRRSDHLAAGTWGTRVLDELQVRPDERIIDAKHTYDAFEGTDLDYALRSRGVKSVVICGTNTDRCCEATARRAFSLQYNVMFGSDVNSTDSGWQHLATLRSIRFGIGRV